jgi:hypothetical protein
MSDRTRPRYAARQIFAAPIVLGLLSGVGLVTALVGDGPWDAVSWLGLGLPVVVCVWYGWLRKARIS